MIFSSVSKYVLGLTTLLVLLATFACSNAPIITPERDLQQAIHYYLFDQQPVSGQSFVQWANVELTGYSARQVQKGLFKEANRQAKEGHPNAIAALSFADQAWSEAKHLNYDRSEWSKLQEKAKENLVSPPADDFQLWPQ